MSSTKDFDRYWSPDVEKLVNQLKEARERKTAVVNNFVNEVSTSSLQIDGTNDTR